MGSSLPGDQSVRFKVHPCGGLDGSLAAAACAPLLETLRLSWISTTILKMQEPAEETVACDLNQTPTLLSKMS